MKRPLLVVLLVVGVLCAGVGVALNGNPFGPVTFGWTAYAPLSHESYPPVGLAQLTWMPRVGLALLAVGAGSAGAALTALVLLARTGRRRDPGT